jgi:hypothetical protein
MGSCWPKRSRRSCLTLIDEQKLIKENENNQKQVKRLDGALQGLVNRAREALKSHDLVGAELIGLQIQSLMSRKESIRKEMIITQQMINMKDEDAQQDKYHKKIQEYHHIFGGDDDKKIDEAVDDAANRSDDITDKEERVRALFTELNEIKSTQEQLTPSTRADTIEWLTKITGLEEPTPSTAPPSSAASSSSDHVKEEEEDEEDPLAQEIAKCERIELLS